MLNLAGYRQTDQLYAGTRTIVYRATRTRDNQPVIIKVLRNPHPNFNELVQFRNQYTITKHLEHPGVVQPLALERYGNGYALIMPDEGAIALPDYWKQSQRSISEFLHIAIQLTEVLHYLNQQRIIHKDIKPANILICPQTRQIKLIDFSISSLLPQQQQQLINPNVLEGTLAYISPEQTGRMNRGIDYRTDFYSLGITFYELLTGVLPFNQSDPMELIHCHIAKMPEALGNREHLTRNREDIPKILSDIVLKLMAKNAEDRYQSALGLKHDLEKCWHQLKTTGEITGFEIGKRDICSRFLIPEKLYGREKEVQSLLDSFERVAEGTTEMMLVAGFSGIGKTAVVNEVHKPIVRQRGYFIKGKFDQFNRNIPFSAFVQALRDLMGQLLSESDAELKTWKQKILSALGDNGQTIVEVIPELERIIGQQPAVPELSGSAAQNRFNLLFSKFLQVFTTKAHPLTIFLDDLQWADSASLKLLKLLMSQSETGYLLLLGAYRDNEVFPAHPLMLTLKELAQNQARISTIVLPPLAMSHINQLAAQTLSCSEALANPLTELLYQKTQGNPFFTTQFLQGLHQDGFITFNVELGYWECDLTRVRDAALTDDVVQFMAGRLHKLPDETQELLKLAACIGNQFDLETLAIVSQQSAEDVAVNLWGALQEVLLLPINESYKFFQGTIADDPETTAPSVYYRFLHDRVQQAAYALIPEDQTAIVHYQIGQIILKKIPPETRENKIFILVNQLNYGMGLITEQSEREQLAQLNLIACQKAKNATAYQTGRAYAKTGLSLLGSNPWREQYKITLNFHELAAELASLCGDRPEMENLVETVINQAKSSLEQANVYRCKILSHTAHKEVPEAIAVAQEFLQKLQVSFPDNPTENDLHLSIAEINQQIGNRNIEDLVNLPEMSDAKPIAIVQIINSIMPALYISNPALFFLMVCCSVKLSIQFGNTPASAYSYSCYSMISFHILKDINTGVKFGNLALEVVSKLNAKAVEPEVFSAVGLFILHRQSHLQKTLSILKQGYTTALEVGNQDMAGYNAQNFCLNSFWCGQPLAELEPDTRNYYHALLQLNQLTAANWCLIYWQSLLNLLGLVNHPSILSGQAMQESDFYPQLVSANDLFGLYFFYLYKLMLGYLFGEIESAQTYADNGKNYLKAAVGTVGEPEFYFYDSLTILAGVNPSSDEISTALQQVTENQAQLQQSWANHAPMNFQHKVDLVAAEQCRVQGQKLEAIELYDQAIAGAKENGFVNEEALANELAAKFYLNWGKETIAEAYLQKAYYAYARWGAQAKISQLEATYPQLLQQILQQPLLQQFELTALTSKEFHTQTIAPLTQAKSSSTQLSDTLDFTSLLKAAQSLTSTIELNPLLAEISQIILTNSGAAKAVLLIPQDDQWQLRAIAQLTNDGQIKTNTRSQLLTDESPVPMRLIQYVKNTLKPLVINEGKTEISGIIQGYLLQYQPQSVFCLPLLDRSKLVAILYLEHPHTKGVFNPERQTVVQFLCTQAAISLQNAQLYEQAQQALRDLQQVNQDLKQAQLQLVQSEKMSALGNLVAGVAHEINNPTGFLKGNIQPAQDYLKDLMELIEVYESEYPQPNPAIEEKVEDIDLEFIREDFPELLESMHLGVERIRHISKSLRTFSRKDEEHKTKFKIEEGIESTLLILKHRTKASEQRPAIQIITDYQEIPEVQCFPGQLNQVFMNILANAIDAFEEANVGKTYSEIKQNPNQIKISLTQLDETRVQIQIQDNGCGMTPETQARIFEQGYTTKGVGKGTGLGMAIAHQIVTEKHGGTITCDSVLGKGTTFAIGLPI